MYGATLGNQRYNFSNLATLLAKASPLRSGDILAGIAAQAQFALADLPLRTFLEDHLISYESDEITRLIADMHNAKAFAVISHLTVGGFRDWLLSDTRRKMY
jgi:ethanolamine ammonia-lyase large subunit